MVKNAIEPQCWKWWKFPSMPGVWFTVSELQDENVILVYNLKDVEDRLLLFHIYSDQLVNKMQMMEYFNGKFDLNLTIEPFKTEQAVDRCLHARRQLCSRSNREIGGEQ